MGGLRLKNECKEHGALSKADRGTSLDNTVTVSIDRVTSNADAAAHRAAHNHVTVPITPSDQWLHADFERLQQFAERPRNDSALVYHA